MSQLENIRCYHCKQWSSGGGCVVACPETQQQRRAQPTTTPTAAASRQFSHHSSGPIRAEIGDHVTRLWPITGRCWWRWYQHRADGQQLSLLCVTSNVFLIKFSIHLRTGSIALFHAYCLNVGHETWALQHLDSYMKKFWSRNLLHSLPLFIPFLLVKYQLQTSFFYCVLPLTCLWRNKSSERLYVQMYATQYSKAI